jgi:predicted nucleotidyltransferase
MKVFEDFVGFKFLEFFLFNASNDYNINEVAEQLEISTSTAKRYCDSFLEENVLILKRVGNQKRFSLNNPLVYVKQLKTVFSLIDFREKGIEKIVTANVHAMVIYGSFASGEYLGDSDLDLLIIGKRDEINTQQLTNFKKLIKRELQLTVYDWVKWEKMKKEKHPFAESIQNKHILVKGDVL